MSVFPGIDTLKASGFAALKGRRAGLLTHAAACDLTLTPTYDLLAQASGVDLRAIFSPEHGLLAAAPDGILVAHATDAHTGLPVHSLYGQSKRPTAGMLDGLDVVVIDLVDVGARFYTYVWTISLMLEACGEHGVEVLLLDRPNPIATRIHGLPLEADSTSFVGRYAGSLPMAHGLTLGELARYFNTEFVPRPCALTVQPVAGWRRRDEWPEALAWIPASPNIPRRLTTLHYPGAALVEGTTLSEGRGTALPFEVVGAPGIDGFHLAERLNRLELPGVRFRPHAFQPTASKHAGMNCQGVQAHITQRDAFDPVRVWLSVLSTIRVHYLDVFDWIEPFEGHQHFDLLIGNTWARPMIDTGTGADEILAREREVLAEYKLRCRPYLLYE